MQLSGHCTIHPSELNLSFADLNCADEVGFTYMGHNGSKSWLDHVAVSSCFLPLITNVHTINDGRNLSDHNPLVFCMDSSCTVVEYRPSTVTELTARAWCKANSDHINKYQSVVQHSLVSLNSVLDDDIISCCNPACTAHQKQLEQVCDQLVDCLKVAADSSIPGEGPGKCPRNCWLVTICQTRITGKPVVAKKHCHPRYKYAVRPVRRRQDHIKSSKLAEALLQSPNCNFCSEVHRFSGNKKPSPSPVVDILTGSDNIANLFSNNFK